MADVRDGATLAVHGTGFGVVDGLKWRRIGYEARMAHPLYVLLPEGVEWTAVPGTIAQRSAPVRWYLRQSLPTATTQTGVLVEAEGAELDRLAGEVAVRAGELGGIAVDASTQQPVDPARASVAG